MYRNQHFHRNQHGFLVPLAAIIVVGLGVLAIAISRISGQGASIVTQEGLAVQAFYAADSGAQYGMNQIYFTATDRASADANCTGISVSSLSYSVTGLNLCATNIACSIATDGANTTSYYTITSEASCGSGDLLAERTVQVSAFIQ